MGLLPTTTGAAAGRHETSKKENGKRKKQKRFISLILHKTAIFRSFPSKELYVVFTFAFLLSTFYLVPRYPPKINARFREPQNAGSTPGANAAGASASFECGSFVRMSLEIENDTKIISLARFQTNGCGFMIAAADVVAEMLAGRKLTDLHGLVADEYPRFLKDVLEEFPPGRKQCAELVFRAVNDALADYRAYRLEEFSGEKTLICTCFGVSEETIEAYIDANSPASFSAVTEACRAGGGCGSCRMLIQEMIDRSEFQL